jgi:translation elongation factor EF-1alpha
MGKYGYTAEHAKAAFCLGIKQLIVCINKVELINDQVERYGFIKTKI